MKTIIEMAHEAGLHLYVNDLTEEPYALVVERFAALVRADEREACAKVCDELHPGLATRVAAEHIRARGNT